MESLEGSKLYSFEFTKASYLDFFLLMIIKWWSNIYTQECLVTVTQDLMTIRIRFKKIIRSIQFYSAQNNYSGKSYLLRNSNDSYHWKKDSSTSY